MISDPPAAQYQSRTVTCHGAVEVKASNQLSPGKHPKKSRREIRRATRAISLDLAAGVFYREVHFTLSGSGLRLCTARLYTPTIEYLGFDTGRPVEVSALVVNRYGIQVVIPERQLMIDLQPRPGVVLRFVPDCWRSVWPMAAAALKGEASLNARDVLRMLSRATSDCSNKKRKRGQRGQGSDWHKREWIMAEAIVRNMGTGAGVTHRALESVLTDYPALARVDGDIWAIRKWIYREFTTAKLNQAI